MNIPGEDVLNSTEWERFAKIMAGGIGAVTAHMRVYGGKDKASAKAKSTRILRKAVVRERITYLRKQRENEKNKEIDLSSVIKTCREVIETSESTAQRLKSIEVLNKLGVFDNETRDDNKRMDPSAICEYLASFRGAPAEHLKHIPGGAKWMFKSLMKLTGLSVAESRVVLDEIAAESMEAQTPAIHAIESSKPSESEPLDFESELDDEDVDDEGDETLKETITAPQEPEEMSEAMRERLAPASEVGKVEF